MATIRDSSSAPAGGVVAATLSNTTDEPKPFRGIFFSTEGAIKIRTDEDVDITIPTGCLVAGMIHPIRVKRVFSTGTDALDIHGVF